MMASISAASSAQEHSIEQVKDAIGDMDDVTQQNAALVEEAAAAAESMRDHEGAVATDRLFQDLTVPYNSAQVAVAIANLT